MFLSRSILAFCLVAGSLPIAAQRESMASPTPSLAQLAPELNSRLVALERAHGVLIGALIKGNGTVDEADVLRRLMRRASELPSAGELDVEADRGFGALGTQTARLIRDAHTFHREVLAVVGSSAPSQRRVALDAVVRRYQSNRMTLADAPKDMSILYDHPYSSFVEPKPPAREPTRVLKYPSLTGFIWSAHWYELAAVEPLEAFDDVATREQGLATIAGRLTRKLSAGEPLDGYPTELPLTPAIAPGLVAASEEAAAIIDNLHMMLAIIEDVLVHPAVRDRRAAINQVVAQFVDRQYRCVQAEEWIVVALRHSIFDQGGFALAPMAGYERRAFGHGQHYAVKRPPPACDPQ
jgi:hypothetical protein